jgi:diguanylate cyclase (GGDEF)-like protein/PAS domain S-box-containing protein/putative nucleotidyltransferase with HDIG domain
MTERRNPAGVERDDETAVLILDRAGRVLRANAVAVGLLGGAAEVTGQLFGGRLRARDTGPLDPALDPVAEVGRTGQTAKGRLLVLVRDDGSYAWVRAAAEPCHGPPGAVVVTLVDVDREHAVLERLSDRARRLEGVLRAAADYVYVWEYLPDGRSFPLVESISSTTLFGFDDVEGLEESDVWQRHIHPEDVALYQAVTDAQAVGESGTGEYRLVRDDGSVVHVFDRWHGSRQADGVATVEGIISDVTVMRTAQAEARSNAERFRALAESAPVGIYLADEDGRLTFVNDRYAAVYGLPVERLLADGWTDVIHAADRAGAIERWEAAVAGAAPYEATLRIDRPDGATVWVESRGAPMFDATGRVLGYVGTDTDVTERIDAERELERRSLTDPLTGLPNRRRFAEHAEAALPPRTTAATAGIVILDIDHFKQVNDVHGHQAGDAVLRETARRIAASLSPGESAARWGGEEFCILVRNTIDAASLSATADRILARISARPIDAGGVAIAITASAGAAIGTGAADTADVVLGRADSALYAAKRRGRNRTVRFDELTPADQIAEEPPNLRVARGLALAASIREGMPELHCEQVSELAAATANELGLPPAMELRCRLGGLVHDVGKLAIPDRILGNSGQLDEADWLVMRRHAEIGAQIIRRIGGLDDAVPAVLHHHERYDGSGYPHGLVGEEIPIEARIVAAADAYSAITSDRPYARGRELDAAFAEIHRSGGTHLDPHVGEALERAIRRQIAQARHRLETDAAA